MGEAEGRLHGLPDDQLRLRPQGWNSIAYLLWHMARCEDVAANVVVAQRPQVFGGRVVRSSRDQPAGYRHRHDR